MSKIINNFYDNLTEFLNQMNSTIKNVSNEVQGKSENKEEYLSYKHVKMVENILISNPNLGKIMVQSGNTLKKNINNESRKKELISVYYNTIKNNNTIKKQ